MVGECLGVKESDSADAAVSPIATYADVGRGSYMVRAPSRANLRGDP